MSKYTTEIRYICENAAGMDESKGYADVDSIISASLNSIFSFSFPIFDESYRDVICTKILRHYYTREIGLETVGLWKLKLQTKMNEIMPYYNQLYKSELLKFNPLYDVDLSTTHVGNKDGNNTKDGFVNRSNSESVTNNETVNDKGNRQNISGENRNGESKSDVSVTNTENAKLRGSENGTEHSAMDNNKVSGDVFTENDSRLSYDLYSDTPQGALNGVDAETYLTNARKITDTATKNSNDKKTEINNETKNSNNSVNRNEDSEKTNVGVTSDGTSFSEDANRTSNETENRESQRTGTQTNTGNANETSNSAEHFNSTETYTLHVLGKQGGVSFSKMLKDFRDTFLNIDMLVINDLNELFMNIW